MKEKKRILDKNNMTFKLEKMVKDSIAENQISRSRLAKKRSLQERGITLIALVVTIIILLILAGVTLNIALSDNGLFSKTQEAADKYKKAQEDEELEIEKIEYMADGKDIKEVQKISTLNDFKEFRESVNKGDDYENTLVKLYCDLDLSDETWVPIGTVDHPFKGVFNGNEHKIQNLKLEKKEDSYIGKDNLKYIGLFGFNEGIIKGIGIESVTMGETDNKSVIGMIVGYNIGRVERCYNKANVTCTTSFRFGGIVGNIDLNGSVSKCYNQGNLQSGSESEDGYVVCGIVGGCWGSGNAEIRECFNSGKITNYLVKNKSGSFTAGLCAGGEALIDSCYNVGEIKLYDEASEKISDVQVGGLEGRSYCTNGNRIVNCYNAGEVTIESKMNLNGENIGSLVGKLTDGTYIENSYFYSRVGLEGVGNIQSRSIN